MVLQVPTAPAAPVAPQPQPSRMPGPQDSMMPDEGGVPPTEGNGNSGESDYDTNFDAGVEADEDSDPKRYIQQLTGKLSQTLGTYNSEEGGDEELSKYVGKMIVKQAAKALDEKGRKELIRAINTTASDGDDSDASEIDGIDTAESATDTPEEAMNESYRIGDLLEAIGVDIANDKVGMKQPLGKISAFDKKMSSPFCGKRFRK